MAVIFMPFGMLVRALGYDMEVGAAQFIKERGMCRVKALPGMRKI